MGEIANFASNGGTASGYLAKPADGAGKGIIVIQEWWGLNDNIKGIADRFAAEGFLALAPDLYHGQVTGEPDEARKMLMALNIPQAEKDLRGAITYLSDLTTAPVGTIGFDGRRPQPLRRLAKRHRVGPCADFYVATPPSPTTGTPSAPPSSASGPNTMTSSTPTYPASNRPSPNAISTTTS